MRLLPRRGTQLIIGFLLAMITVTIAPAGSFAQESGAVLEQGIVYGQGGDVDLELDLARPATGDGPFPAIVFIHGGGWQGGSRTGYLDEARRAAEHGYVAVTVTYRLTNLLVDGKPKYLFPEQVHDVKCAVRWVRAHAAQYHVDPERIGVTGGSAGGHLSLMVGLADSSAGLEGNGGYADQSSRVQAVVNYFGPTELASCYESNETAADAIGAFLGGPPQDEADRYKAASPVTYVDRDDPPILTLHGSQDGIVPAEQAKLLDAKMKQAGAPHTLVILEGQPHGFRDDADVVARAAMYAFFDKHLKNPAR